MLKISKFRIFAFLSIVYAIFIFYLSSLSDPTQLASDFAQLQFIHDLGDFFKQHNMQFAVDIVNYSYDNFDKIVHMFLYFGFGILLHLTFRNSNNRTLKHYAPIFAILIGVLYGITDEIHQSFVPGRSATTDDLLANSIGLAIAQIIFWLAIIKALFWKKEKKRTGIFRKAFSYLKALFSWP
nr:VanZ family protein [Methanohalophilus levihalophilus]